MARWILLVLTLAATLVPAAEITIFIGGEPETLDPGRMSGHGEAQLAIGLFEGLVGLDPKDLSPVPGLAERWERTADGLTWTFHLRAGLRWSDGAPLTADQVVASWRRAVDPATASDYAVMLDPIAGAAELRSGRPAAFGAEAPDGRTVVVRLVRPCAWFLDIMAFSTCYPVRLDVIAAHGDRWTRPEHFVGNGPYRLAAWAPRDRIVLEANPHWRDAAGLGIRRITTRSIESVDTAWRLYRQGALHWMNAIPLGKIDEIRWDPDYYVAPFFATYFYRCNVSRPPLSDVRVRRALSLALDRRAITEHVLRAGQLPATSFVPATPAYPPPPGPVEDAVRARALLAEAGYGPANPMPPLSLFYNTSDAHKQIAEAVAEQWSRQLGIQVRLENAEWKVYLSRLDQLDYQIARSSWIGDYLHPATFLDLFQTGGGNNRTGWSDPAYDAALAACLAEPDPEAATPRWQALETRLLADGPVIPLYTYVNQGLVREELTGWWPNVRDLHPLHTLRWEPATDAAPGKGRR